MPAVSKQHSYIGPRQTAQPMNFTKVEDYAALRKVGICLDSSDISKLMQSVGMDALISPTVSGAGSTINQFLQSFLPGLVHVATQPRLIDDLIGVQTAGSWEDEEIVQGVLEYTGKAQPYGDYSNIPLSSFVDTYERRTIVRFEEGLRVGKLEEKRMAKQNINAAAEKREAAQIALDIERNRLGFLGYNGGANRTYGFLNDPGLPSYVTVPNGAGGTPTWATKTFLEIVADIRTAFRDLRVSSNAIIDPKKTPVTLAIASNSVDYLTVTSTYGNSVNEWLEENYPLTRVVSAPELNGANGGSNVFYAYAEKTAGTSTDGGATFVQVVAARFFLVGTEQQAKAMVEDYSNALGGVMLKRPWAVRRYSGI